MTRTITTITGLITATLAAAALTGCAASSSPGSRPSDAGDAGVVGASSTPKAAVRDLSSFDACTLLTRSEAATLAGVQLNEGVKAGNSDVASCTYDSDPSGPTRQVEVYLGAGAKQQLDIDKDKLGHSFTQPSGLGDEAWQEDDMIWVRHGQDWFSLRLVELDDASKFVTPLQTAAKIVLSRL